MCHIYLVGHDSESYNSDIHLCCFWRYWKNTAFTLHNMASLFHSRTCGSAHSALQQTGLPTSHVDCGRELNYFIMYGSSKSKSLCGIMWVREHWCAHVIVCCSRRSLECSSVKILVHQIEI